jgi:hypothetical protein
LTIEFDWRDAGLAFLVLTNRIDYIGEFEQVNHLVRSGFRFLNSSAELGLPILITQDGIGTLLYQPNESLGDDATAYWAQASVQT